MSDLERLRRLVASGDEDAAWQLQSEARRRDEPTLVAEAVAALDEARLRDVLEACWSGGFHEALLIAARKLHAVVYLRALAAARPDLHLDILHAVGFDLDGSWLSEMEERVERVNAALMAPWVSSGAVVQELIRAAEQGFGHRFVGPPGAGYLNTPEYAEIVAGRSLRGDAVVLDVRRARGQAPPGATWLSGVLSMTTTPPLLRETVGRWCRVRSRLRLSCPLSSRARRSRCLDAPRSGFWGEVRWVEGRRPEVHTALISSEMSGEERAQALDVLKSWLEVRVRDGRLEVCDSSPSVFWTRRYRPAESAAQSLLLDPGEWRAMEDGSALECGQHRVHIRYMF